MYPTWMCYPDVKNGLCPIYNWGYPIYYWGMICYTTVDGKNPAPVGYYW
jgi:hypothetical protein